jgi:hypothetical protein
VLKLNGMYEMHGKVTKFTETFSERGDSDERVGIKSAFFVVRA